MLYFKADLPGLNGLPPISSSSCFCLSDFLVNVIPAIAPSKGFPNNIDPKARPINPPLPLPIPRNVISLRIRSDNLLKSNLPPEPNILPESFILPIADPMIGLSPNFSSRNFIPFFLDHSLNSFISSALRTDRSISNFNLSIV